MIETTLYLKLHLSLVLILPDKLGKVVVDDPKNSITKCSLDRFNKGYQLGIGITDISTVSGGSTHTISFDREHNFNSISGVTITSAGSIW